MKPGDTAHRHLLSFQPSQPFPETIGNGFEFLDNVFGQLVAL
jgi:hypothetical protein